MTPFSQELIERTKVYFRKKYDLELSSDLAEEYLDALARFYEAMVELRESAEAHRHPFPGDGSVREADEPPSSYLYSLNT